MSKHPSPKVPFVEAFHVGSKQRPTAIVLDLSETTSDKGAALAVASQLHTRNAPPTSYHYLVDEAETYQGVWDRYAAYNSPYRTLNVLICGQPQEKAGIWELYPNRKVLNESAVLVAKLTLAYRIPVRYLQNESLMDWEKHKFRRRGGIILRVRGEWPYETFLKQVNHDRDIIISGRVNAQSRRGR